MWLFFDHLLGSAQNIGSIVGIGFDIGEDIYQYNQDKSKMLTAATISAGGTIISMGIGSKFVKVNPVENLIKAAAAGVAIGSAVSAGADYVKPTIVNMVEDGVESGTNKVKEIVTGRKENNDD